MTQVTETQVLEALKGVVDPAHVNKNGIFD